MSRKVVAERLRGALERKNWAIYELSKRVKGSGLKGLSYSSLRNYVSGKSTPKAEVLQILADELEVPVGSLIVDAEQGGKSPSHQEVDIETGSFFTDSERGRVFVRGTAEDLWAFRGIATGVSRFPDLPTAGRDLVMRFLYDLHFAYEDTAFEDPARVERMVETFFPGVLAEGTYGAKMVVLLSYAQVAYLRTFGNGVPTGTLDELIAEQEGELSGALPKTRPGHGEPPTNTEED